MADYFAQPVMYKRVPKKATYAGKEYTLKVYEDTTEEQMQTALEIIYGPEINPVSPIMVDRHGNYVSIKINNPHHPRMVEAVDLVYNDRDLTAKPKSL